MTQVLSEAIRAIRSGDRMTGRRMLTEVLKADPGNELAWMWMTTVVASQDELRFSLQKILAINPANERAKQQLASLELPSAAGSSTPPAPIPPAPAPPAPPVGHSTPASGPGASSGPVPAAPIPAASSPSTASPSPVWQPATAPPGAGVAETRTAPSWTPAAPPPGVSSASGTIPLPGAIPPPGGVAPSAGPGTALEGATRSGYSPDPAVPVAPTEPVAPSEPSVPAAPVAPAAAAADEYDAYAVQELAPVPSRAPGSGFARFARGPGGFWSLVALVVISIAGWIAFTRDDEMPAEAEPDFSNVAEVEPVGSTSPPPPPPPSQTSTRKKKTGAWRRAIPPPSPPPPPQTASSRSSRKSSSRSSPNTRLASSANEPGVITKTAEPIADLAVAGGGRWLVLQLESTPGLSIYDADTKSIRHTIRLASSNFRWTAGGEIALIYFPENNLLQAWDIRGAHKLKTKPNPKGATITYMTMGHSNGDVAWIRYAEGTDALDRAGSYLLDIATLREVANFKPAKSGHVSGHNSSYRNQVHQRTDSQMRIISEWVNSHSPTGLGLFLLDTTSYSTRYDHTSVGYIAVGDDGLIYTQKGQILNRQLTQIATLDGMRLVPALGGAFFLGIAGNGTIQVYPSGSTSPITSVGQFPGFDAKRDERWWRWGTEGRSLDRHVVFDPENRRLILIPPSNDRLVHRTFDLDSALRSSGVDHLVVVSSPESELLAGRPWRYRMEVMTNAPRVRFSLDFGPEGMRLSDDGTLSWTPPAGHNQAEKVVVLVEGSNGESVYHNFQLRVRPQRS